MSLEVCPWEGLLGLVPTSHSLLQPHHEVLLHHVLLLCHRSTKMGWINHRLKLNQNISFLSINWLIQVFINGKLIYYFPSSLGPQATFNSWWTTVHTIIFSLKELAYNTLKNFQKSISLPASNTHLLVPQEISGMQQAPRMVIRKHKLFNLHVSPMIPLALF